jgi:hypothetical protein
MGLRLLIAAGEAAAAAEKVPDSVRVLVREADHVLVIAPTLPGRIQWIVSDTDKATERADERLQVVLGQLEELGTAARGQIGSDDPLVAFEDAVREFTPDHLLIALRREDRAGWQERGLLDKLLERFAIPITVFRLPGA